MELFSRIPTLDFMGKRKITLVISAILFIASLLSFAVRGLNWGLDFTGGMLIEVSYAQPVDLATVRGALAGGGFGDAVVQHIGTAREVLVRIAPRAGVTNAELSTRVLEVLRSASNNEVELRRVEFVGPQVGQELAEEGSLAMLIATLGILIYVAVRYEYRMAVSAVIATLHDIVITLGLVSVLYLNFDLTMLAAILTVMGYSINDTIVVFDRIRENFRRLRKEAPVEVMNISINQTLSRTLITGPSTLLVLLALYYFGGAAVEGFALALLFGVVIGTFSSIYVASPVALLLGVSRSDLLPVKKEEAPKEGAMPEARPLGGGVMPPAGRGRS
jgi:preprotein translocase subunit SecF